ncbi:MAG: zinc ribbon domain-containing protein [Bacteroidetes bacterium]|nr:zinc ribbon domain-containing protein [Bacteroidota bacterium]MCL5025646.1 zinc ribbon domain-containing protein [Chloroflexota bacterium]
MPTYEFRCSVCGHKFELNRPISEASQPAACPKCGAEAQKQLSSFTFTMS